LTRRLLLDGLPEPLTAEAHHPSPGVHCPMGLGNPGIQLGCLGWVCKLSVLVILLPYITHLSKLLMVELILAYHGKRIRHKEFERLYNMTKYEQRDVKRNHALEVVTQATPQTHTHGQNYVIKTP